MPTQGYTAQDRLNVILTPLTLVVDLDGTLIFTDTLIESALTLIRRHPRHIFSMLFWLAQGVAHLNSSLFFTAMYVSSLPRHIEFLAFFRLQPDRIALEDRLAARWISGVCRSDR